MIPVWEDEERGVLEAVIVRDKWMTPAEARKELTEGPDRDCVIHGPACDADGNDRETFTADCLGCLWAALYADPSCAG